MWNDYLQQASGDSVAAFAAIEADVLLFSGEVLALEKDKKVADSRVRYYQKLYGEEKGLWYDRLWDSDITKTLLFLGGFYLGAQQRR